MQNQNGIAPFGVERAPRFVRHGDVRQSPTELEREPPLSLAKQLNELPPARGAPGLPRPRAGPLAHAPFAARNPASRSARMSSTDSMPTESLTRSGDTPVVVCSASVSCEWVVDAGWMARLRTSPTLARWLNSSNPSMNRLPASAPPAMPKAMMEPPPLGRYFFWRSCQGLDANPGYATHDTSSRASSHSATATAFCTCRSMRRLRVSSPWRKRNELSGAIEGPVSRRYCRRALSTNRAGKSGGGGCPQRKVVD